MIPRIVRRQKPRRIGWITRGLIQIDHAVVGAARANPRVELEPLPLALSWRGTREAAGWRKRRTINHQSPFVRTINELLMPGNQFFDRHFIARISRL